VQPDRESPTYSRGLGYALFTLLSPAGFEAAEPDDAAVPYRPGRARGIPPLCDIYVPSGPGPHRSMIIVHGGAFVVGSWRMKPVRLLATRMVARGFAVCAFDYRLLFRGGGFEAQLEDVDHAARFWRERCPEYGCDPARISMAGFSAGATLMLLHASGGPRYERLVNIHGVTDFELISGRRADLLMRLVHGSSDRGALRDRSPVHRSDVDAPILSLHGTDDRLVSPAHSTRLHERRRRLGLPSELELFEGMRHGWFNVASLPETERGLRRIERFLG